MSKYRQVSVSGDLEQMMWKGWFSHCSKAWAELFIPLLVRNNSPEWFDWRCLLKNLLNFIEVWTENDDHYLDLTTTLAAVPLLISNLLEQKQHKRQDRCFFKYRYFTSIFLFIESHKLNIMWQQPQHTSISIHKYLQQSCANPSKNGKDFVFHTVSKNTPVFTQMHYTLC